ncbi:hypothetical protein Tco_1278577, partial [Tanacetum coccineum]
DDMQESKIGHALTLLREKMGGKGGGGGGGGKGGDDGGGLAEKVVVECG